MSSRPASAPTRGRHRKSVASEAPVPPGNAAGDIPSGAAEPAGTLTAAVPRPKYHDRRGLRLLLIAILAGVLVVPTAALTNAATMPKITSAVQAYPTLHRGSESSAVKWVQLRLGVRPATSYFGKKTRAAVIRFQKAKRLKATGWVTAPTWRALGVSYKRSKASATAANLTGGTAFGTRVVSLARSTSKGAYYRYGGSGPKAFDCSGFVGYVLRKAGKKLPRTASAISRTTKRINKSQVRPGDLVFTRFGGRVTHVAIYAGGGKWYEASNPRTGVGLHKAWTKSVFYGRVA